MPAKNDITRVVNRGWPEAADTISDIGRRFANGSPASIDATAARADAAISAGFPCVRMTKVMKRPKNAGGGPDWASGRYTAGGAGTPAPIDRTSPTIPTIRID